MWGIIPAAGVGSRIQPLAFSKELLPVGSRIDGDIERPRAVSEYIIERMIAAGTDKICFVISPGKSDIMEYYGGNIDGTQLCYVVQPQALGLCDSIFRAVQLMHPQESVVVGLPDTIWFPLDGLGLLPSGSFCFLLFPVDKPELFDAVLTDSNRRVTDIQVKTENAQSRWVWGAFKTTGAILCQLCSLWQRRGYRDVYIGDLVNAYIAEKGVAYGIRAGTAYVDVGTLHGYREAMRLLCDEAAFR
jgi:dTDP-glucose pyrophosphorylase